MTGGRIARPLALRGRAAFTLIEMLISVTVLAFVLGAMALVQIRSQATSQATLSKTLSEMRARRALDRVVGELSGVAHGYMFPDPTTDLGTSAMTYQHPTGVDAVGNVTWDVPSRLELQLEPGEVDNGIDDDSNGLVDERRLVLTRNFGTPNAQSVVLCTGIPRYLEGETPNLLDDNGNGLLDEPGFNIFRVGDLLTVRLTVQVPLGGGRTDMTTVQTSIVLRN
jgi:prepilin-type N-terminal cleavage/methylation domain-containing protein